MPPQSLRSPIRWIDVDAATARPGQRDASEPSYRKDRAPEEPGLTEFLEVVGSQIISVDRSSGCRVDTCSATAALAAGDSARPRAGAPWPAGAPADPAAPGCGLDPSGPDASPMSGLSPAMPPAGPVRTLILSRWFLPSLLTSRRHAVKVTAIERNSITDHLRCWRDRRKETTASLDVVLELLSEAELQFSVHGFFVTHVPTCNPGPDQTQDGYPR